MADPEERQEVESLFRQAKALHAENHHRAAIAALRRALQIESGSHKLWLTLGLVYQAILNVPDALRCFDRALRIKPDNAATLNARAASLFWSGRIDEGLEAFEFAARQAPNDNNLLVNIGVARLLKGDYRGGADFYSRRQNQPKIGKLAERASPWQGEKLDGKTLLVTTEQGMGDAIQFIRYVKVLKQRYDCKIVVVTREQLQPLLATCEGIDALRSYNESFRFPGGVDFYCQLMSLPEILLDYDYQLGTREPYLVADADLVRQWQQRLANEDAFRIGICWQGNFTHKSDKLRSIPLKSFHPLMRLKGVRLFSLQKGEGTHQLRDVRPLLELIDLGSELDETTGAFVETAAVLKNLDLLICCDTSVGHLAGSLGVPTWLALAITPDWRWGLDSDTTPWYSSTRLFRQQHYNQWPEVFDRMTAELLRLDPRISLKTPAEMRVGANTARARHGLISCLSTDIYVGRSILEYGEFSEPEAALMSQLLNPGDTVIDAGANIGTLTLPMANLVGRDGEVQAFEPQPEVFELLKANIEQNHLGNVQAHPCALGAAPGELRIPPLDYTVENNFGGLSLTAGGPGNPVEVTTIDSLALDTLNLLKVDVEGAEREVLRGAQQTIRRERPLLYIENDREDKSAALIAFIQSLGYRLYWHIPRLYQPDNYFRNSQNHFDSYASINMLCIHRERGLTIKGLREILGPGSSWRNKEEQLAT